jgi:hypothetical protein
VDGGEVDAGDIDLGPNTIPDSGGYQRTCDVDAADLEGCPCTAGDPARSCWPYFDDPVYRGVGACADGAQQCVMGTEFATWGPCTGAVEPAVEDCANGVDDSCDGVSDCGDPMCATDAACMADCTDGMTRSCYTGPAGTLGVGACHAGSVMCVGGHWDTTCVGQVTPRAEDCTTPSDLNCNHLAGCWDLFVCALSPACQEHCDMTMLGPGCVCPDGQGDVATCPRGMHAITHGTLGGTIECCPCTPSDCGGGDTNCCQETVCAGSAYCAGLYCPPLPASCMGRVNTDCDDFPEDCDEPCCECYGSCSGP